MKTKYTSSFPKLLFAIAVFAMTLFTACNEKQGSANNKTSFNLGADLDTTATVAELAFLPSKIEAYELGSSNFAEDEINSKDPYRSDNQDKIGKKANIEKKIIKDGNMSIKAKDIAKSKSQIDTIVKQMKAYFDKEELQNNDQMVSYSLTIRVPSQNFEKLVAAIEGGNDEITYKSINSRDVTDEYIDVKTRLENKKAYLAKYRELLKKAGTVKDILAIEDNIRNILEEIESKEGRLKYLNDQVELSTLELYLEKRKEYAYKPQVQDKFSERVKTALSNGWKSVVNFAILVISWWPIIIIISGLSIWISIAYRNRKNKK